MTMSRKQYERALKGVEDIERNYSIAHLRHKRPEYVRTKDRSLKRRLKKFNNLLLKYNRHKRTIEQFTAEIDASNQSIKCENCQRAQCSNSNKTSDTFHVLEFHTRQSTELKRRKFQHIKTSRSQTEESYSLCAECNEYLTTEDATVSSDFSRVWPAYVLSNESVQSNYGSQVWSFIPFEWRKW